MYIPLSNMCVKVVNTSCQAYGFLFYLVKVLVYTDSTKSVISSILLNGWLGPSSEWSKVSKVWLVIVVSIPQWEWWSSGKVSSHDWVPLGSTTVYSGLNTSTLNSSKKSVEEFSVLSLASSPVTKSFDIEPDHSNTSTISSQVLNTIDNLSFWANITCRAWAIWIEINCKKYQIRSTIIQDITINEWNSSSVGILNGSNSIGVNVTQASIRLG